jgi:NAD(P)-dependent dehydrogenase (short-subunit alcohol dehydrogenase family)
MASTAKEKPVHFKDPRETEPKQPYPEQIQEFPGHEHEMTPRPDYGEKSYKGSGKLEGMKALITGADSGIGRAVALAYAREGADVLISYFNEDEDAEETAHWVREAGRKAVVVAGDIQDERHCKSLVDRAMKELDGLDILVNNAAFQMSYKKITEMPSDEFDRAFRTNVYAMFYLCKAAMPHMKPGSSIINTTSVEAYNPLPILLPYATTKGAIATFTKALAQEAIEQGIRVNAVAPGPVWTPLIPYSMPQEAVKTFGNSTPMKRAAQPAELAPVYVLLASQEASYIAGMIYGVTGGMITA